MAEDWGTPEVLPAEEADTRVESTGGVEDAVLNLVLTRMGNPDLNGVTLKDYLIAIVRYYTWNAAKKEVKLILTLGPKQYLEQRKNLVNSVVKRMHATGFKGGFDRVFSRATAYLEDTLNVEISDENDIPQYPPERLPVPNAPARPRSQTDGPQQGNVPALRNRQIAETSVEKPIAFERPRTTAMARPEPTYANNPQPAMRVHSHSSAGCNPFTKDNVSHNLLSDMKMVWPTRPGESDADYFSRIHKALYAYQQLIGYACG